MNWYMPKALRGAGSHRRYATRAEAEASIREYIEIFYNRQRRHSRLGYVSPAVFVDNFIKQQASA